MKNGMWTVTSVVSCFNWYQLLQFFLFSILFIFFSNSSAGEKQTYEARLGGADELYNALKLNEVDSSSGANRYRYKGTVSSRKLSEGGLYCERRLSTDCVLVSKVGLSGRVVILQGLAAKKIFNAINPERARAQYIQPDTTYYHLNGLVCLRTINSAATNYVCTASDS